MSDSYFNLKPGRIIAKKYKVLSFLGAGWEGEVYKIIELGTEIERAAKIFYPERNQNNEAVKYYAKKLYKLRNCSILIGYYAKENFLFKREPTSILISEYVDGILLSEFIRSLASKKMPAFEALHLLYALTCGLEQIHNMKEYHGDLHSGNIIVNHFGLQHELKLIDLHASNGSKKENQKDDIVGLVQIFYEALGGRKYYSKQHDAIKYICCGLKSSLILKKFKTVNHLRTYIENMSW